MLENARQGEMLEALRISKYLKHYLDSEEGLKKPKRRRLRRLDQNGELHGRGPNKKARGG